MSDVIDTKPTIKTLTETDVERTPRRGFILWESPRLNGIQTRATTVTSFQGIHTWTPANPTNNPEIGVTPIDAISRNGARRIPLKVNPIHL